MQACLLVLTFTILALAEPNPPNWPQNVFVFDPRNSGETQTILNKVYAENGGHNPPFNGQWSNSRYAFLFKPGTHNVEINVGYYTGVYGLGVTPADTTVTTLQCENGDFDYSGGALDNFWRSVENLATGPTLWAVSQAAPMRRMLIRGDLELFQYNSGCCAGFASGGFLSDSIITGKIQSGSQQQWFTRNTNVQQEWQGGVWNMVFVGNTGGIPASHCGPGNNNAWPITTVPVTPVIAEKPYITIDGNGKYTLRVPKVEFNKVGPTTNFNAPAFDFSQVYVATQSDSAQTINAKLAAGLHIVFTPGNYFFEDSIKVNRPNTVILGIGFPVITPLTSNPIIIVGNVDGVRIAGLLLEAGKQQTSSLLQWGTTGYPGNATNPGILTDIFGRVGGSNNVNQYQVKTDVMVQINSGHVVIDNTWLWRADHDVEGIIMNSENPSLNGLVVNGNDVIAYALAVEHQLQDLVVWNGDRGQTFFYQSEFPYDVTQQNFGDPGYVAYRISNSVRTHSLYGAGMYSFFRDHDVTVADAIVTPQTPGIMIVAPMTKFLNGLGQITHIVDKQGNPVNETSQIAYKC